MASILPKGDIYLDNGFNVLLQGLHGVGKTEAVLDICRRRQVTLKYYSCATLDPYTDLVGVPVPRKYCDTCRVHFATDKDTCPVDPTHGDLREALKMVRPQEIDEAELIFFDELNRADPKVLNAVMEIIQFRSINGERLPKVVACWGAINPPEVDGEAGTYEVDELDPALVDRFDVFEEITPRPSVAYMEQHVPKPIAQALYSWWQDHDGQRRGMEGYISPRRLMKIGLVYDKTGSFQAALPKWIKADRKKLGTLLERAKQDAAKTGSKPAKFEGGLGQGANPNFTYDRDSLKSESGTVAQYLAENQQDMDTHNEVLNAIKGTHGKTLANDYAELLNALKPSIMEGFIASMNPGKLNTFKENVAGLPVYRYNKVDKLRTALGLA